MKKIVLLWMFGTCAITVQAQERQLARKIRGEAPVRQATVNTGETSVSPSAVPVTPVQVAPPEEPPAQAPAKEEQPQPTVLPETSAIHSGSSCSEREFYTANASARNKYLPLNQIVSDKRVLFLGQIEKISATCVA